MSYYMTTTDFGFKWNGAEVIRLASHPRHGAWIRVRGERESVDVRVTKGGRIRLFSVQKKGKSS